MKITFKIVFTQFLLAFIVIYYFASSKNLKSENTIHIPNTSSLQEIPNNLTDTADYNRRMKALYKNEYSEKWKIKTPYPKAGAVLPYKRVVAFYGNLYSKKMGILGEIPKDQMLKKLQKETDLWQLADPNTPAIPALQYIAITAQGSSGAKNKYRQRMPFKQIDTILKWAKSIHALVILDVQPGQSAVQEEVNTLQKYLKLPNVHLAIDPEFSMKNGDIPGTKIGTMSSNDINDAVNILQKIVKENDLPPKILIIHRFTQPMVTDYQNIKTCPEVQIVMNMDGFGDKALKRATYRMAIEREPVQFCGCKLFFKNDTKNGQNLLTPQEVLKLTPIPIYIQYQ